MNRREVAAKFTVDTSVADASTVDCIEVQDAGLEVLNDRTIEVVAVFKSTCSQPQTAYPVFRVDVAAEDHVRQIRKDAVVIEPGSRKVVAHDEPIDPTVPALEDSREHREELEG